MAIEIIQTANVSGKGTSSWDPTFTYDAGVQDGDIALFVVNYNYGLLSTARSPFTGAGLTELGYYDTGDGFAFLFSFSLSAAHAGTEHSFNIAYYDVSISMVVLRNAAINATAAYSGGSTAVATIPSVTPTVADTLRLAFLSGESNFSVSPPTGWSALVDTAGAPLVRTEVFQWTGAPTPANTATGAVNASLLDNGGKGIWHVAFEPLVVDTPVTIDLDTPTASLQSIEPEFVGFVLSDTIDLTTAELSVDIDDSAEYLASADVSVEAATVALAAVEADATVITTIDLDTATMSAATNEPVVDVQVITIIKMYPTADFMVMTGGNVMDPLNDRVETNPTYAYSGGYGNTTNVRGVFEFDALPQGVDIVSINFKYRSAGGTSGVLPLIGVVATTPSNYYSAPVTGSVPAPTSADASVDLTELIDPTAFKALKLYTDPVSKAFRIHSTEATDPTARPYLEVAYQPSPSVTVDVPTAPMTLQAPDAIVEAQRSTEILLDSQVVTLDSYEVEIGEGVAFDADTTGLDLMAHEAEVDAVVSPDAIVEVGSAAVYLQMPEATIVLSAVVEVSHTDTVMLGSYDPTVELTMSVDAEVDTPTLQITRVRLTDVNGEPVLPADSDDPYYVATMNTLAGITEPYSGGPVGTGNSVVIPPESQQWYRMNETSGTIAYDRLHPDGVDGRPTLKLNNVVIGLKDGPEDRHHFYFNGEAFAEETAGKAGAGEKESGIEFTFRTTKRTQFIMGNADYAGKLWVTDPVVWELWLVDGKLEIRTGRLLAPAGSRTQTMNVTTHTAFTDLADGQWHHVVLQAGYKSWANTRTISGGSHNWGLELVIDGNLEMRRREPAIATYGFPDFIGGRPNNFYPDGGNVYGFFYTMGELPRSQWFVGDMTELVYRNGRALSDDEISRQRDAMFGVNAIWTQGPSLSVDTDEAVVRGNKPRMLVLHFGGSRDALRRLTQYTWEPNAEKVLESSPETLGNISTGEVISQTRRSLLAFPGPGDWLGSVNQTDSKGWPETRVERYHHHVIHPLLMDGDLAFYGARKDEVTDNYRLIDLDLDLNMDDFDIISIVAYPTNQSHYVPYDILDTMNAEPFVPARKQLENLMEQIKEQVIVHGKGLFVPDPSSAIALGIVDQIDVVPEYFEHAPIKFIDQRLGAVNPGFDAHGFAVDPFNGPSAGLTPQEIAQQLGPTAIDARLRKASRYTDQHGNIMQRVRAEIPGLTDIKGGHVRVDTIEWMNVNPFNEPPYQLSIRYEDKSAGLKVGDHFQIDLPMAQRSEEWLINDLAYTKYLYKVAGSRVAAPMSAVKVGTVVTSFATYMYNGIWEAIDAYMPIDRQSGESGLVGNPFYDHAISIAIQPGDIWDGKVVQGKVYVNFTESKQLLADYPHYEKRMAWEHLDPEVRPSRALKLFEEVGGGNHKFRITPEMARYQFSTHYGNFGGTEINFVGKKKPDWGWSAGGVRGSGLSGGGAEAMNWSWDTPYEMIDLWVPTMSERGLLWLTKDVTTAGTVAVNVPEAKVTTKSNDVVVETTSNAHVDLSTARVVAEGHDDLDTENPDVRVMLTTATVLLRPSGVSEDIYLDVPTVTLNGEEVEYEAELFDWNDAMVLTFPRQIETLILEDN